MNLGCNAHVALWDIVQDGRSSSLTAPNGPSQQMVILGALQDAALSPDSVSGLEMHGTGTALGDPIEVGALAAVLKAPTLRLTAAKSITGHAEPAAGTNRAMCCSKCTCVVLGSPCACA